MWTIHRIHHYRVDLILFHLFDIFIIYERIAFSIVRVDVRYPDGIVGIVLQYGSVRILVWT